MNLFVISYDLNTPGKKYETLIARLQALGAQRILYSQWMLRYTGSASELTTDLWRYMDANDRLLVNDVTHAPMAWFNLMVEIKPAFNIA